MSISRNWTLAGGDFTILHEDGRFRLYCINGNTESFIAHACSKDSTTSIVDDDNWWTYNSSPCPRCHESAPDEIVALYTLHNWDQLQNVKPWPFATMDTPV